MKHYNKRALCAAVHSIFAASAVAALTVPVAQAQEAAAAPEASAPAAKQGDRKSVV